MHYIVQAQVHCIVLFSLVARLAVAAQVNNNNWQQNWRTRLATTINKQQIKITNNTHTRTHTNRHPPTHRHTRTRTYTVTMSERKRYHKDNAPTDDIITLINLVRENPALYNYKLQPNQRRRPDILSGWQAVSQKMGSK